jgi:hypothetical protein
MLAMMSPAKVTLACLVTALLSASWRPGTRKKQEATFLIKTIRGRTHRVHIQAWRNMLMRGTRNFPMHRYPFTLVRIEVTTEDGTPIHRRPLWLLVMGERGEEMSLWEIYAAYTQPERPRTPAIAKATSACWPPPTRPRTPGEKSSGGV